MARSILSIPLRVTVSLTVPETLLGTGEKRLIRETVSAAMTWGEFLNMGGVNPDELEDCYVSKTVRHDAENGCALNETISEFILKNYKLNIKAYSVKLVPKAGLKPRKRGYKKRFCKSKDENVEANTVTDYHPTPGTSEEKKIRPKEEVKEEPVWDGECEDELEVEEEHEYKFTPASDFPLVDGLPLEVTCPFVKRGCNGMMVQPLREPKDLVDCTPWSKARWLKKCEVLSSC